MLKMLNYLMMMLTIFSIVFLNLSTPLSMMIMLIMQTMLISLICSYMINSFWYSYIMVLIMVSGLLILFMYMASIASNEKFNVSVKMLPMMMLLLVVFLTAEQSVSMKKINMMKLINYPELIMKKLFNYKFILPTIMMIMMLLLMMIVISFMISSKEGPMRKSN